jgi:hypothetical protein
MLGTGTMERQAVDRPPAWFWIIALPGLAWEALGCMTYWRETTMNAAMIRALPQYNQILIGERPLWATALFAVAAWFGLAGMIALLLRRGVSEPILFVSLLASTASATWPLLLSGQGIQIGVFNWTATFAILGVQWVIWTLARHADRRGWLRYFR